MTTENIKISFRKIYEINQEIKKLETKRRKIMDDDCQLYVIEHKDYNRFYAEYERQVRTIGMTPKIEKLIKEYKADPNCRPVLWIQNEKITELEKKYFIEKTI